MMMMIIIIIMIMMQNNPQPDEKKVNTTMSSMGCSFLNDFVFFLISKNAATPGAVATWHR